MNRMRKVNARLKRAIESIDKHEMHKFNHSRAFWCNDMNGLQQVQKFNHSRAIICNDMNCLLQMLKFNHSRAIICNDVNCSLLTKNRHALYHDPFVHDHLARPKLAIAAQSIDASPR